MTSDITLTRLEFETLERVRDREYPWTGGPTRVVSQALGRLRRKGLIERTQLPNLTEYVLTETGKRWLDRDRAPLGQTPLGGYR